MYRKRVPQPSLALPIVLLIAIIAIAVLLFI